ncbi:MAG TPA: GNAT family N-acetyltransferase [Flavisolibacter sp.]|jgi:RimJ/RimL family protein N-acetyltransferase|nr:GNAT family N-acetyltransferase [Flavisolibacter sp.]
MNYIFQTQRLRLREFSLQDASFLIALMNSPGWLQYIGDKDIKTAEAARQYLLNGPIKSYTDNGFGLSLVEKIDGVPIGMCGIIRRDYLECPDIGFALLPQFTGMGYAYEVANQTLLHAKSQLKLPKVAAITMPQNQSSIKLLEKLGMQCSDTIILPHSKEALLLYVH